MEKRLNIYETLKGYVPQWNDFRWGWSLSVNMWFVFLPGGHCSMLYPVFSMSHDNKQRSMSTLQVLWWWGLCFDNNPSRCKGITEKLQQVGWCLPRHGRPQNHTNRVVKRSGTEAAAFVPWQAPIPRPSSSSVPKTGLCQAQIRLEFQLLWW